MLQITPKERAALRLLAGGHAAKEIADCLGFSESELDAQLAMLFLRMGAVSQIEAVAAARRRGLLTDRLR